MPCDSETGMSGTIVAQDSADALIWIGRRVNTKSPVEDPAAAQGSSLELRTPNSLGIPPPISSEEPATRSRHLVGIRYEEPKDGFS